MSRREGPVDWTVVAAWSFILLCLGAFWWALWNAALAVVQWALHAG